LPDKCNYLGRRFADFSSKMPADLKIALQNRYRLSTEYRTAKQSYYIKNRIVSQSLRRRNWLVIHF